MHATEGEEAARAQFQAGVDVRVTRVRNQKLVGTAAIKREDFLAGLLVDHRGRIGVLELVFPAAGTTQIDVHVHARELVGVEQIDLVVETQGVPVYRSAEERRVGSEGVRKGI